MIDETWLDEAKERATERRSAMDPWCRKTILRAITEIETLAAYLRSKSVGDLDARMALVDHLARMEEP